MLEEKLNSEDLQCWMKIPAFQSSREAIQSDHPLLQTSFFKNKSFQMLSKEFFLREGEEIEGKLQASPDLLLLLSHVLRLVCIYQLIF